MTILPVADLASFCLSAQCPSSHVPPCEGFSRLLFTRICTRCTTPGCRRIRRHGHVLSLDGFAPHAYGVRNGANAHARPAPAGKSVDGEPKTATLESFLKNRPAKEESKTMNFGLRGFAPSALADRISDASANLSTLKQGILGGVGADAAAE